MLLKTHSGVDHHFSKHLTTISLLQLKKPYSIVVPSIRRHESIVVHLSSTVCPRNVIWLGRLKLFLGYQLAPVHMEQITSVFPIPFVRSYLAFHYQLSNHLQLCIFVNFSRIMMRPYHFWRSFAYTARLIKLSFRYTIFSLTFSPFGPYGRNRSGPFSLNFFSS